MGSCQLSGRVVKAGTIEALAVTGFAYFLRALSRTALIERAEGTNADNTAGLFHVEPLTTCRTCSWCCGDSNCMTVKPISFFYQLFFH